MAIICADTLRPSRPIRRQHLVKTSDRSSATMTLTTKKTRAHRSSPTSSSKDAGAVAVDEAEEGAAEAEEGVAAEGGADHSAPAAEGVSAAAAEVAASAGDEDSADVAGASGDQGGASTAASIVQTAHRVRARTAVALAPSRLSTYSTQPAVFLSLRRMETSGCICLLRPALTHL